MRNSLKILGAAALIGLTSGAVPGLAGSVAAQDDEYSIHAGSIEVPVNKSQVITADRPIARAMIGNPRLIIADEPTSALDSESRDEFMKLLFEEVSRAQAGLILVSHDEKLAAGFDRKLEIAEIALTDRPATV